MAIILAIFGSPWLGHGRKLEATLAGICLTTGLVILWDPGNLTDSKATVDLFWLGYGRVIALPFLLKAVFTGLGVVTNILGFWFSWFLRWAGAGLGSGLWIYLIFKYTLYGSPFAFGSICAGWFLFSSIGIMAHAWADLPRPGAPGSSGGPLGVVGPPS